MPTTKSKVGRPRRRPEKAGFLPFEELREMTLRGNKTIRTIYGQFRDNRVEDARRGYVAIMARAENAKRLAEEANGGRKCEAATVIFLTKCSAECLDKTRNGAYKERDCNHAPLLAGTGMAHSTTTMSHAILFSPNTLHKSVEPSGDGWRASLQVSFEFPARDDKMSAKSKELQNKIQDGPVPLKMEVERDSPLYNLILRVGERLVSEMTVPKFQEMRCGGYAGIDRYGFYVDFEDDEFEELKSIVDPLRNGTRGPMRDWMEEYGLSVASDPARMIFGDRHSAFSWHVDSKHGAKGVSEKGLVLHLNVMMSLDYAPGIVPVDSNVEVDEHGYPQAQTFDPEGGGSPDQTPHTITYRLTSKDVPMPRRMRVKCLCGNDIIAIDCCTEEDDTGAELRIWDVVSNHPERDLNTFKLAVRG